MISLTFEEKLETAGNLIHDQRVLRIVDSKCFEFKCENYKPPQPLPNDIRTIKKILCINRSVMAIML